MYGLEFVAWILFIGAVLVFALSDVLDRRDDGDE